jgi:prepilin-type N-terminal cleavage/methylation domain-containing protein
MPYATASARRAHGFTLIELLVVIAIIGILATIVTISLSSAHDKGNMAAVRANLRGLQEQAQLYYNTQGSYGTDFATTTGGSCPASGLFSESVVANAIQAARSASAAIDCGIGGNGEFYEVIATLPAGRWCVNSLGIATSSAC